MLSDILVFDLVSALFCPSKRLRVQQHRTGQESKQGALKLPSVSRVYCLFGRAIVV